MRIQVIYDNNCSNPALKEGWGFSCLIEEEGKKILFDTGGDLAAFRGNIEKLGIQLHEITSVVFSHKHGDHIAGFDAILADLREDTRVFVPKTFEKKAPDHVQLIMKEGFSQIDSGVYSLVQRGGFSLYEQSLILDAPKGLIILTGCAHPGIVSIIKTVKKKIDRPIYLVIGGFHLFKSFKWTTTRIVGQIQALGVEKVAPCHCTGQKAIDQFEEAYGLNFIKIGTGSILTFE